MILVVACLWAASFEVDARLSKHFKRHLVIIYGPTKAATLFGKDHEFTFGKSCL